jgi:hypothetical protein
MSEIKEIVIIYLIAYLLVYIHSRAQTNNFEFIEFPIHWWAHFPTGYCPIDGGDFRMIGNLHLNYNFFVD